MATKKPTPSTKKPAAKKAPAKPKTIRQNTRQQGVVSALGGLTPQEVRFIDEYVACFKGGEAVLKARITDNPRSAEQMAYRYLKNEAVTAEIARRMKRISDKTQITAERVVQEAWGIVTADVNDLVEFRRTCCRHCYGIDYGYQRTMQEMSRDRRQYELEKRKAMKKDNFDPLLYEEFDEQGGIGYDARRPPNEECQECFGHGVGNAHFKDTRQLSPEARALYAGVKQTKDGYQMLLIDKNQAMEKLFKHLGLYKEDNKQKADAFAEFITAVQAKGGKLPIKPQ